MFRQEYIFIIFRFFVLGYIIYFYVQRRESCRVDHWLSPVYATFLSCHFGSRSSQCNSHKHRDQIIRCVTSTRAYGSNNDSHMYTHNLSKIRDIDRGIRDCAMWLWLCLDVICREYMTVGLNRFSVLIPVRRKDWNIFPKFVFFRWI